MAEAREDGADWRAIIEDFTLRGRHHEPYANTTEDSIRHMRNRWSSFCSAARLGDPHEALCAAGPPQLKAFFQWVIVNAERAAQQGPTLKQYFRVLKMVYKQVTGALLDDVVVSDVNAFIQYYAEGKTKTSHRPKPVPSGADFVNMLHFLYSSDWTLYPDERQRVQQGFLMIIHAYSGLRPSSTTQSGKRRKVKASSLEEEHNLAAKLRYGDVALILTEDDCGHARFAVRPTFKYFKGGNRRPQQKTFTWFDQPDVLTCPVAHLISLALHDEAFRLPALHRAQSIFDVTLPAGQKKITLHWRDDVLNKPILRSSDGGATEVELPSSVASKRLRSLGEKMGYREPVTWYWLRRLALNAVDGAGSEEVRNQVAGHLDSRTYRNNYQDQHISLDVASLVRGRQTEDALMQKLNHAAADIDPDCNLPLAPETLQQIATLPDVVALEAECCRLTQTLRDRYGAISAAPSSDSLAAQHTQAQRQYRARKQFHRSRLLIQQRRDFFAHKDTELIKMQLSNGGSSDSARPKQRVSNLSVPERATLVMLATVGDLSSPTSRADRSGAVQAMADLCRRVELSQHRRDPETILARELSPRAPSSKPDKVSETDPFPLQCLPFQCLFCLGDKRLIPADRTHNFNRQQALWKHARKHLDAIDERKKIFCPHPKCRKLDLALSDIQHLKNHGLREHGIRLQCR
ncbi:hypothetical protein LTR74_018617 [Friedmanniomyces endolithicus]|nr:hypothetical protein LTR74_018617 [Friedmanniomyces endolithicus]